jgi:MFS family permease
MLSRGEQRVFRFHWLFRPETSIARRPRFQYLLASTFFADAGRDALRYGSLIAVVRESDSAFPAALIGVASLIPPAIFGLYGGIVSDALPKRAALAVVYTLQAALCFAVPTLFGTSLQSMLFLVFTINLLGQVSGPSEQSIVPLVASEAEFASANALQSLSSNLGMAFGAAVFAPVLVRLFGVQAVLFIAGIFLLIATGRIIHVRTKQDQTKFRWQRPNVSAGAMVRWLIDQPAVGTMIMVGVLAGVSNVVLQTLAPQYVESVLHLDAADAVYVFAPSAVGLALALFAGPALIRRFGERSVALVGFFIAAFVLVLLGLVRQDIAVLTDPINPLRFIAVPGVRMGAPLRTAMFLALPVGFAMSLTTTAVQTYINRRVPLAFQGRTFALQSTLKNGSAIVPLLTLGAAASVFGVDTVLLASPFLLIALAFALVRLSVRFGGRAPTSRMDVLQTFWDEPDTPIAAPPGVSPGT